mgnify:CR=1 FL=1
MSYRIFLNINSIYLNLTLTCIIKSWNKLDKGRLCTSGSADDTYCLPGFNMKVYILQRKISSLSCIAEIYMIKVNRTICHILYCISFILSGFNIFGSAFFTALNNGGVSAAISFLRTLVFQAASVILLPMVLDVDGLWWAASAAEVLAFVVSIGFLLAMKGKYHYFDET